MATHPPYLYSDADRASQQAADVGLARRRRKQVAVAFVAVALVFGVVGAALDHVISSPADSLPRATASSTTRGSVGTTTATSAYRVYAVNETVLVDGWEVVLRRSRISAESAPPGSMWLLVDAEIANRAGGTRQLSPEILEVRYQLRTRGYAIKAPDRGIAPLDEIATNRTVRRTLGYVVPSRANGFVVLFRAAVASELAHRRAAEINLSCC